VDGANKGPMLNKLVELLNGGNTPQVNIGHPSRLM
jgi:hypothetical protein